MVALLNYLPLLVTLLFLYLGYRAWSTAGFSKKLATVVFGYVVVLFVLHVATAHYMPKLGTPPRLSNPAFEKSEAVIEDRLAKPSPDIDQRYEEKFDAVRQATEKK